MLIYNGVDPVTVSHRLGHDQVSTTTNTYSHMIADADSRSADIISDALNLKKHRIIEFSMRVELLLNFQMELAFCYVNKMQKNNPFEPFTA